MRYFVPLTEMSAGLEEAFSTAPVSMRRPPPTNRASVITRVDCSEIESDPEMLIGEEVITSNSEGH